MGVTKAETRELFTEVTLGLSTVFPVGRMWQYLARRDSVHDREPMSTLVADGIMYGEGPRFRLQENALYYVDMYGKKVFKYDLATKRVITVFEHDDYLSGLGWLPDGRLLVVAMNAQRLLVVDQKDGNTAEYADLSAVTRFRANDMVVDAAGRAFVGNFGFNHTDPSAAMTTTVVRVDTDRSVHVASTGLLFPNGSVVTPDGKTLIVAETFGFRLTAFDIAADGSLSNRRLWADVGLPCDGIALDAEGCVWAAVPFLSFEDTAGAVVRVREGGEIANLYGFGHNGIVNSVFACQLGTDAATGKHYLYFHEAVTSHDEVVFKNGPEEAKKNGVLKAIEVAVGPARIEGNDQYCGGYC